MRMGVEPNQAESDELEPCARDVKVAEAVETAQICRDVGAWVRIPHKLWGLHWVAGAMRVRIQSASRFACFLDHHGYPMDLFSPNAKEYCNHEAQYLRWVSVGLGWVGWAMWGGVVRYAVE